MAIVCGTCGQSWKRAPVGYIQKCQCGAIIQRQLAQYSLSELPLESPQVIINRYPRPAVQSRADSWIEVAVNIAIGAAVSLAAQAVVFPLYGIHVGAGTHLGIVAAFTVVSVVRQYVIRRLCNGRSPWMFIKGKWCG